MHWINPVSGPRRISGCDEVFNCGANTELSVSDISPLDYVRKYEFSDGTFAYIMETKLEEQKVFAMIYFEDDEHFAYNLGYAETMPSREEAEARLTSLREWADMEEIVEDHAQECFL